MSRRQTKGKTSTMSQTQPTSEVTQENSENTQNEQLAQIGSEQTSETNEVIDNPAPEPTTAKEEQIVKEEPVIESVKEEVVQKPTPQQVPKLPVITKKLTNEEAHNEMILTMRSELDRILKGMKPIKRMFFDQIIVYMEEMRPGKPVDPVKGSKYQFMLMNAIKSILNSKDEDGDFKASMIALLKLFDLGRKAALGEMYVFRFMENVERPADELNAFASSVNMLLVTCDGKSRDITVRQIDFNKTLRLGFSEEARRRILDFYGQ